MSLIRGRDEGGGDIGRELLMIQAWLPLAAFGWVVGLERGRFAALLFLISYVALLLLRLQEVLYSVEQADTAVHS